MTWYASAFSKKRKQMTIVNIRVDHSKLTPIMKELCYTKTLITETSRKLHEELRMHPNRYTRSLANQTSTQRHLSKSNGMFLARSLILFSTQTGCCDFTIKQSLSSNSCVNVNVLTSILMNLTALPQTEEASPRRGEMSLPSQVALLN